MIRDDLKLIHLHVPKAAGKSIEKEVFGVDPVHLSSDHRIAEQMVDDIGIDKWNEYFKFAFVRNPYDRMLSQWFYYLKLNVSSIRNYVDFKFENFIRDEYEKSLVNPDQPRVALQKRYIIYNNKEIDFVGKTETMEEDWIKLNSTIGTNFKLLHINTTKHHPYQHYYNDESKRLVDELWGEDLDYLGYTF